MLGNGGVRIHNRYATLRPISMIGHLLSNVLQFNLEGSKKRAIDMVGSKEAIKAIKSDVGPQ